MRQHRDPWIRWTALEDRSWNFRPFEKRQELTNRETGLAVEDIEHLDAAIGFMKGS